MRVSSPERIHSGVLLVEAQLCNSTYRTVQGSEETRNSPSSLHYCTSVCNCK